MVMDLLQDLWKEFLYILPYLAIGVLFEAIIRTLKWHVKIRHALTRFGSWSILFATLLGVISPLCACATLPLVISLMLAGLPLAPAMALLVTSPLMSPASYSMVSGMLGVDWANTVVVSAIFLGLFSGLITLALRKYGFVTEELFRETLPQGNFHDPDYPVEELRCDCGKQLSHKVDRCTHNKFLVFLAKFWEGSLKIGKFALIGMVIEVVASALIPNGWLIDLLTNGGLGSVLAITFATIPLHLPQVTATSMLFGFFLPDPGQTIPLAPGPGIAMLVGGPVTALPVMGIFLSMFKKRVFFLYLGLCVSGTLLLAFCFTFALS